MRLQLRPRRRFYFLLFLMLSWSSSYNALHAQEGAKRLLQLPKDLLKGIAAADFQKTSALEYLPFTAIELPRDYLESGLSRPRLISNVDIRRARMQLYRDPYTNWHQLMIQQVERFTTGTPRLSQLVYNQAEEIKVLAFLYRLEGDERYRDAALSLLRQLPEPPKIINLEGGRNQRGWGDFLESARALVPICVAVDLLYDEMDPDLQWQVRDRLSRVAAQLNNSLIYTTGNNHMTVIAIAILTLAMIEDDPAAFTALSREDLWQQGWYSLSQGLGLIAPDGGYAESVYYGRFIMSYLSPFSLYLENVTGARLFQHPLLQRHVNWLIANDKGSGTYGGFDDAFQIDFLLLPPVIRQSSQQRNWMAYWQSLPPLYQPLDNLAESLVAFELRPSWLESDEDPVQFFAESGQVIFRDQALRPNFHATFLSERESWFAARHEHVDPFSFEMSAFGEDFIVDAGYGRGTDDANRAFYLSPEAGNGILIDGYGLYRNPIWGDPISSEMRHAARFPRSAMASLAHQIGDMRLQRKLYFIDDGYLLMIDRFEGHRSHTVGLNMNYRGQLKRLNAARLQLDLGQARLDMLTLGTVSEVRLTEDAALQTVPSAVIPIRSMQLLQQKARQGAFLSAYFPLQMNNSSVLMPLAISGEAEAFRVSGPDLREADIAVNRGGQISTARWRTDAQVAWVQYDLAGTLSGLLLVDASSFEGDELQLEFGFPTTIFLERDELGWYGQVEGEPDQPQQFLLTGIEAVPFRLNSEVLAGQYLGDGKRLFHFEGGGEIGIGMVRPTRAILRHQGNPDMLEWLSSHADTRRTYQYASEFYRQGVRNQITRRTFDGVLAGSAHLSQRFFGDARFIRNAVYVGSGMLEASYDRNAASTFIPRLPHRYRWQLNAGNTQWRFREEGTFSSNGIDIRRLDVVADLPGQQQARYRLGRWFEGHRTDELHFARGVSAAYFKRSRAGELRSSIVGVNMRDVDWQLSPGYQWRNGGENLGFLNWRWRSLRGNVFTSVINGQRQTRQQLSGETRNLQLFLAGEQLDSGGIQNYQIDGASRHGKHLQLAYGTQVEGGDSWRWQNGYLEVAGSTASWYVRSRVQHIEREWHQSLGFSWRGRTQRIGGYLDLTDLEFLRGNRLQLYWHRRFRQNRQMQHRLDYRYYSQENRYLNTMSHSLQIPLGSKADWHPLAGYQFPSEQGNLWLGSGLAIGEERNTYLQLFAKTGEGPASVQYELSTRLFNAMAENGLWVWGYLEQSSGNLIEAELRLQPLGKWYQPGIFYAYSRNGDRRLEGVWALRW